LPGPTLVVDRAEVSAEQFDDRVAIRRITFAHADQGRARRLEDQHPKLFREREGDQRNERPTGDRRPGRVPTSCAALRGGRLTDVRSPINRPQTDRQPVTTARRPGWVDRRRREREDRRVTTGDGSTLLAGASRWVEGLGRLRDVVRQRLVAAQLGEVMARQGESSARVLDVGCGQGTQLSLARTGRQVTGLDISDELLTQFAAELASVAGTGPTNCSHPKSSRRSTW